MAEWLPENFQWLKRNPPDNTFMQAFQIGANLAQQKTARELQAQELTARLRALEYQTQIHKATMDAKEQVAAGHAELGTVLSEIGAANAWTDPASKAKFWATAAKHPQLMKDPSFKELTQNFELADKAKLQSELLGTRLEGQQEIETSRQQNRLELLDQRLNRLFDTKLTDQEFKIELENLRQEHQLERDRLKPQARDFDRLDLNKSDEIAMRAELASLQTALSQMLLEPAEATIKQEAIFKKYRAKARTPAPAAPATTNAAPKVLKFNPATNTFE